MLFPSFAEGRIIWLRQPTPKKWPYVCSIPGMVNVTDKSAIRSAVVVTASNDSVIAGLRLMLETHE